jgi:hypothetical protein
MWIGSTAPPKAIRQRNTLIKGYRANIFANVGPVIPILNEALRTPMMYIAPPMGRAVVPSEVIYVFGLGRILKFRCRPLESVGGCL